MELGLQQLDHLSKLIIFNCCLANQVLKWRMWRVPPICEEHLRECSPGLALYSASSSTASSTSFRVSVGYETNLIILPVPHK